MRLVTTGIRREHYYVYLEFEVWEGDKLLDKYSVQLDYPRGIPSAEMMKKYFKEILAGYKKAIQDKDNNFSEYIGMVIR